MNCFMCRCDNNEEVKKFTENILSACRKYLEARKLRDYKYQDAALPDTFGDEIIGYHSSCYKQFRVKSEYLIHDR